MKSEESLRKKGEQRNVFGPYSVEIILISEKSGFAFFFRKTFDVTPRFPAEIFGVETSVGRFILVFQRFHL